VPVDRLPVHAELFCELQPVLGVLNVLSTLILVAPPFIFMKSSKTSDPKPISLYRALIRPLQTQAPPRRIQAMGARRSEVACASLNRDSPWDEAPPKAVRPPSAFWGVVAELTVLPATKPYPPDVVVVAADAMTVETTVLCAVVVAPDAVTVAVAPDAVTVAVAVTVAAAPDAVVTVEVVVAVTVLVIAL
jgi:hypothetical protein